jgi:cytochrome c oxidase assembly factor CtaG
VTLPIGHAAGAGWTALPLLNAVLVLAVAYLLRARELAAAGRPIAAWRQSCFVAGLGLLLVALASPLDGAAEHVFWLHMVQHLLLLDGVALLLLLGVDGSLLRPLMALPGVGRLRLLANPLLALPLWALVLYGWHTPVLYEAALSSEPLHYLEHLSFLAAGLAVWAAVLEPLPGAAWFGAGAKAAYVLVVRTLGGVLGSVLIWAGEPLYPGYAAGEREWGISPLTDQALGGAIMFVEGAVVTLAIFAWLFLRWAREAELRQALLERGTDARVASRAARYGRRALDPPRSPPSG